MKLAAALLLAVLVAAPVAAATSSPVRGQATFFCEPAYDSRCTVGHPAGELYAAAGPAVRQMLGPDWRGQRVRVTGNGVSIVVPLWDFCACAGAHVIDLSGAAFRRLSPLHYGVVAVIVTSADGPLVLPATDTGPPRSVLDLLLALFGAFAAAPFSPVVRRLWPS